MQNNRKIILLSYYFPPIGMGGVGRALALYKHLPEFGYNVNVVTVRSILFHNYDHTLLNSTDEKNIFRTGSVDPSRVLYKLGFRKLFGSGQGGIRHSLLNLPDLKRGWNLFAFNRAKRLIKSKNIDAIVTTSPPPSTHLIGLALKKQYNIPWIADFRDFWFSHPIEMVYQSKRQKSYANNLKRKIIAKADKIVSVNSNIRKYLGRGQVITNGADLDFNHHWQDSKPDKDKFVIGILGTINNLCPIEPLFKSVSQLINQDQSLKSKLFIQHVGHCNLSEMNRLIDKYSLRNLVTLGGYLPKNDAFTLLSKADILFLSVNEFNDYHILPGRTFDYLVSGKPIVAALPQGSDAAALIKDSETGKVFLPDDIEGMADAINKYYMKKTSREILSLPELDHYKFSAKFVADKYVELLDELLND
jgi:glycosyltransferase involved in cell wall biosynthesis